MTIKIPKKAMVLAAGMGRRLRPYTDEIPKPLLQIAGKPLIDWVFDHLEQAHIEEVIINIPHGDTQIQEHLADRLFPKIHFIVEDELLGTGGGIRNALPLLGSEPFFVLHSNIIWINKGQTAFQRLVNYFDPDKMDILSLLVDKTRLPWFKGKGDFIIEDSDHRIKRTHAGTDSPVLGAGIYLVHPRIFATMSDGAFPLNIVLDKASRNNRLYGLKHIGEWYGITTAQDYTTINRLLSG